MKQLTTVGMLALMVAQLHATTYTWDGGGGGGTSWLISGNWNPDSVPGINDEAQFGSAGTANNIGIDMNSAAVNNGANNQAVGAITVSSLNTRTRDIYNSSVTADGLLTLNGLSGTLLSNGSSKDLTIRNGASKTLGLVLAASGDIAVTASGKVIITSAISETGGARSINKTGAGTLILGGANTYSGGTTLTGGHIQLDADNALGTSTSGFSFAGGILDANNKTASIGALSLTATSTLNLVNDSTHGSLTFSSATLGTLGATLTINNWSGTAGFSGTDDRIFITSAPLPTFLANIQFTGYALGATWLPLNGDLQVGEIVPIVAVPEPAGVALAVFGLGFAGWGLVRRVAGRAQGIGRLSFGGPNRI